MLSGWGGSVGEAGPARPLPGCLDPLPAVRGEEPLCVPRERTGGFSSEQKMIGLLVSLQAASVGAKWGGAP